MLFICWCLSCFAFCRLWSSHSSYYKHHPFRMAFHCFVLISRYLGLTRALLRWRWTITTMIILYTFNLLHPLFQEEMLASVERSVTFWRLWAAELDSQPWILMKATSHNIKNETSVILRGRERGLYWKHFVSQKAPLERADLNPNDFTILEKK